MQKQPINTALQGYTKPRFFGLCKLDGNSGTIWEQDDPTIIHRSFQITNIRLEWLLVVLSYQRKVSINELSNCISHLQENIYCSPGKLAQSHFGYSSESAMTKRASIGPVSLLQPAQWRFCCDFLGPHAINRVLAYYLKLHESESLL